MNNKTSIDLNANVSGEMNPNDPDYNEKGQIVEYSYEIKYIRIPDYFTTISNNNQRYVRDPNPTELKAQALALASPTNIDSKTNVSGTTVAQQFSDKIYTYYRYSNGEYVKYRYQKSSYGRQEFVSSISKEQYRAAKIKAFQTNAAQYSDIAELTDSRLLSRDRPAGVEIGDVMVVVVNNNIGLPTYNYSQVNNFRVGKITEEQAIRFAIQAFENDPPKIEYPSADIYSIDEDTGDVIIEEDYDDQHYPPANSEVILVDDNVPIPYTFSSIIVDKNTKKPIEGVIITDPNGNKTQTFTGGNFTIKGEYLPGEEFVLSISKPGTNPGYKDVSLPINSFTGGIRNDINYIEMSSDVAPSGTVLKSKTTSGGTISRIEGEAGDSKNLISSTVQKITDDLTNRTTPYIINELLYKPFGITDPVEMIKSAEITVTRNEYKKELQQKTEEEIIAAQTAELELLQESTPNQDFFTEDRTGVGFDKGVIEAQKEGYVFEDPNEILKNQQQFTDDKNYEVVGNSIVRYGPDGKVEVRRTALYGPKPIGFRNVNIDGEWTVEYIYETGSVDTGSFEEPEVDPIPTGSFPVKDKRRKKYKIREKRPKSTILKRGLFGNVKFYSKGNKRSYQKKNFAGKRKPKNRI